MRNPPSLVAVIAFFAAIAGSYWIYLGLRILGFDWFGPWSLCSGPRCLP